MPSNYFTELVAYRNPGTPSDDALTNADDVPAITARLGVPLGLTTDDAGNVYFTEADSEYGGMNRVRKINTSGVIKTVAGTGEEGFSGDGGPAIAAQLKYPTSVAVAANGDVYIADLGNRRVRMVSSSISVATPPVPANIVTTPGDGQMVVSWDKPTGDGANAITGFTVSAQPGSAQCNAGPADTSCTVTGLTNAQAYSFTVVAHSAAGDSQASPSTPAQQPVASVAVSQNTNLPAATINVPYAFTIHPEGGIAPYSFSLTAGALPAGLTASLSENGMAILISGTPTSQESANFTLLISDSTLSTKSASIAKAGPTMHSQSVTFNLAVTAAAAQNGAAMPVPTLGEWQMLLLSLLAGGVGLLSLQGANRKAQKH